MEVICNLFYFRCIDTVDTDSFFWFIRNYCVYAKNNLFCLLGLS